MRIGIDRIFSSLEVIRLGKNWMDYEREQLRWTFGTFQQRIEENFLEFQQKKTQPGGIPKFLKTS